MKFFLPTLALATMSTVFGNEVAETPERRAQSTLEAQWRVDDPVLDYKADTGTFVMKWTTGWGQDNRGYFNRFAIETFDECPNGDALYNEVVQLDGDNDSELYFFKPTFLNDVPYTNGYTNFFGEGNYAWKNDAGDPGTSGLAWEFSVDSSVASSSAYTEVAGSGVGTVTFCTRVSLLDEIMTQPDVDPSITELILPNFRQILVTINYDLNNEGFAVESFDTQAIEETEGGNEEAIQLEASATLCDETRALPFNQGQEICLNVCALNTQGLGADVVSVSQLVLEINGQPNIAKQFPIFDGAKNGQTVRYGCGGATDGGAIAAPAGCCQIIFLLENTFFPVDANQDPGPQVATVIGSGDALLSLNGERRKLRVTFGTEERNLQEGQATKFEGQFTIDQNGGLEGTSSASSIMSTAAIVGAAGAALLL